MNIEYNWIYLNEWILNMNEYEYEWTSNYIKEWVAVAGQAGQESMSRFKSFCQLLDSLIRVYTIHYIHTFTGSHTNSTSFKHLD